MFEYAVCNVYDTAIFEKQCSALEKHIPHLQKKKLLEDVDGSKIQQYERNHKQLMVVNDKLIGVFITSEFDIEGYFCEELPPS